VGRTYESQTGHLPSHLSQRRPIARPDCLRHITRSLQSVSMIFVKDLMDRKVWERRKGIGQGNLRMMARHNEGVEKDLNVSSRFKYGGSAASTVRWTDEYPY